MAEKAIKGTPPRCQLNSDGCLTLADMLQSFNSPINEEQAWAICYQCCKCFLAEWQNDRKMCSLISDAGHVRLLKDGTVHHTSIRPIQPDDKRKRATSEVKLLAMLGYVIYQALDYSLNEEEERHLSAPLESLIQQMTIAYSSDDDTNCSLGHDCDEGIEEDQAEFDDSKTTDGLTLLKVLELCSDHLNNPSQADAHYKAVCRALVTEALELSTFLEKISQGTQVLRWHTNDEADGSTSTDLENLHINDWARLWVQVIHELRTGVKLKKVEIDQNPHPIEYALTPYEILMDDIRRRRYKLNKVMVNGDIPRRVKKDAHAVILEFIRSRPPLIPVSKRKLPPAPPKATNAYEDLMYSIRQEHRLKPTQGVTVETSRTKLNETDLTPQPIRRLIKADLSLLNINNSFDQEDDDCNDVPLPSPSPDTVNGFLISNGDLKDSTVKSPWQQTVALDLAKHSEVLKPERRHSITLCESLFVGENEGSHDRIHEPAVQTLSLPPKIARARAPTLLRSVSRQHSLRSRVQCMSQEELKHIQWKNSVECLSLSLEEVVHIRSVLTKAELESLVADTPQYSDIAKGKLCFLCKKTKFGFFGPWGQKCKLCKRMVCEKCCSKMRIPTEHFASIPVYTLSPSPSSSSSDEESTTRSSWRISEIPGLLTNSAGSAPSSPTTPPRASHTSFEDRLVVAPPSLPTIPCSPDAPPASITTGGDLSPSAPSGENKSPVFYTSTPHLPLQQRRALLSRSRTFQRGDHSERQEKLCGALMSVCKECKAMVCHIIVASHNSLTLQHRSHKVSATFPRRVKASRDAKPSRDLNLNLSPVY